jgi:hypothetical protein
MLSLQIAAALRGRYGTLCALTSSALLSSSFAAGATVLGLSGAPVTSVTAAHYYHFQPSPLNSGGRKLTFAVSGKPAWAQFDATSGRLYGTPLPANAGTFGNIRISATDGTARAALPAFTIKVAPLANTPPTIAGTPAAAVAPGQVYSFQPKTTDANNLKIAFGIWNKPAWLTFDGATGRLYGTATASNVGTYSNISITAYDGNLKAVLPPFNIAVTAGAAAPPATPPPAGQTPLTAATVSWVPPTRNVDGTAITDLAGYRLYYGTTPALDQSVTIANPGLVRYVIGSLLRATYYFAVTAYNTKGQESDRSELESFVIR